MKLRALVLLLVLANMVFFAWTQGWLDNVVGVRAMGDREPERLARQVRPESLRILPASSAAMFATTAPAATAISAATDIEAAEGAAATSAPADAGTCLEAGPFTPAGADAAEKALRADRSADAWVRRPIEVSSRWIIYMGRYSDREVMLKKADALWRSKIPFELLKEPSRLVPGLSLGSYYSRGTADAALTKLATRGVRTAKVIELAQSATMYALRVEHADTALAEQLTAVAKNVLGDGFVPCERAIDRR